MGNYEFWFIVGSQDLYGEEVLRIVDQRAKEMAEELSRVLPYPLKYKVTAESNRQIKEIIKKSGGKKGLADIHDEIEKIYRNEKASDIYRIIRHNIKDICI